MRLLLDLVDLVLARECAGCGAPAVTLCAACLAVLAAPLLGRVTPDPCPAGLPRTVAAGCFQDPVRAILLAHKERGRRSLAAPLGALLAAAVGLLESPGVLLVPVPSARAAIRARGYDHALRLAVSAAASIGATALPVLRPARVVADQAGLDTRGRAANLAGALVARRRLDGVQVVLVDDVITTGATLVEAARALRAAGALVRGAAVVAATQRRPGPW